MADDIEIPQDPRRAAIAVLDRLGVEKCEELVNLVGQPLPTNPHVRSSRVLQFAEDNGLSEQATVLLSNYFVSL